MRKLGAFKEFHLQELNDPVKAKAYIDMALEEYQSDNDDEALLLALRDVVEAQGELGQLAEKTGLSRSNRPYKEELLEDLRNPSEAAAYLTAALEDGSPDVFLLALRDVAEAHGMKRLAEGAQLNREYYSRR